MEQYPYPEPDTTALESVWAGQGAYASRYRGVYIVWLVLAGLISYGIYAGFAGANWERATKIAAGFGLFLCIVHFWYVTRSKPVNYLAPDLVFLAAYALFHFGYLGLWVLGILPAQSDILCYPGLYPKTVFIVNLGIIGFLFGYELFASRWKGQVTQVVKVPTAAWTMVGLALMVFSLAIFAVYVVRVGVETFISEGARPVARMEWYITNPRLWRLRGNIFAIGFGVYITSVSLRYGKLFRGKLGITLFTTYIVLTILTGARTPVVITGMIILLVRHYLIKPIKLGTLIAIVAVFTFIFVAMGIVRDRVAFNIFKMSEEFKYARQVKEIHWYEPFVETGKSVSTINLTTSLVPGTEPYWHGRSYIQSIVHIVPFLEGALVSRLGAGPAMWLTYIVKGPDAAGTGFSIAGEGYLNFGLVGAFLQMVFIGFLMRRIYLRFASSLFGSAALVFFVSFGIFASSVRNHLNVVLAPLVQVIVLAWLLKILCGEVQVSGDEPERPLANLEL